MPTFAARGGCVLSDGRPLRELVRTPPAAGVSMETFARDSRSTMANADNDDFFEGTEKLLEIWFSSSNGNSNYADLKRIKRLVCIKQRFRCKRLKWTIFLG